MSSLNIPSHWEFKNRKTKELFSPFCLEFILETMQHWDKETIIEVCQDLDGKKIFDPAENPISFTDSRFTDVIHLLWEIRDKYHKA